MGNETTVLLVATVHIDLATISGFPGLSAKRLCDFIQQRSSEGIAVRTVGTIESVRASRERKRKQQHGKKRRREIT
jgi:hypothetical protein